MPSTVARTHTQRLAEETEAEVVQRWRAAETVRSRQPAGADRDELLDCLGLLDAEQPTQGS